MSFREDFCAFLIFDIDYILIRCIYLQDLAIKINYYIEGKDSNSSFNRSGIHDFFDVMWCKFTLLCILPWRQYLILSEYLEK